MTGHVGRYSYTLKHHEGWYTVGDFISRTEAAKRMGRHPETLKRWDREETFPDLIPVQIAGRWFYDDANVSEFIRNHPEGNAVVNSSMRFPLAANK